MKILILLLAAVLSVLNLRGAEAIDESQLIEVLQSDASSQKKDAACTQLKRIGTERCIPALSALLTDEQLSHSARYALEPMQSVAAGAALIRALESTSGLTRVGIINSLAIRREVRAVPALAKLLTTDGTQRGRIAPFEDEITLSAVAALGEVATPAAVKVLESAQRRSSGDLHITIVDALLRSANHMLDSGEQSRAATLFGRIYSAETNATIRIAAYSGVLRASPNPSPLFSAALTGPPSPKQTAALQLVRRAHFRDADQTFANLLPRTGPAIQLALIEGLKQRGDPSSARAIGLLARSGEPRVRTTALAALGPLGDGSVVPLLAEAAASGTDDEKAAARQALIQLHHGDPTKDILAYLTNSAPDIQVELARALGQRGNTEAIPKLLELAREDSGSSRKAAFQALATLAREQNLADLVQLLIGAGSESARSEATEALSGALQRMLARNRNLDITSLVNALESSQPDQRIALLPVCSMVTDTRIREVLRQGVGDSSAGVRTAAIRALCDTRDIELLPDTVKIAMTAPEENFRVLATAASVRLISQEEGAKLPNDIRLMTLKALLSVNPSTAQKRMILAGLAEIPDREALALAEPSLNETEVKNEAASAIIRIAPAVADTELATVALEKVLAIARDATTREVAETVLKKIRGRTEFIISWQAVGPYSQKGKDHLALFDIPFGPELELSKKDTKNDSGTAIAWRSVPLTSDAARPGVMDLLKAFGGEQCVAYARTRIYSKQQQPGLLELGTDDGVKLWFNGELVHAHNIARPLQSGADKVNLNLKAGWNDLLLKVTQNNLGWEFCARLVKPDGSHLEGLQFAAAPAKSE